VKLDNCDKEQLGMVRHIIIQALRRLRLKDQWFKASMGYIVRPRLIKKRKNERKIQERRMKK
jgi:hypothetical protein